jgi:hypothetical protein
MNEMKNGKTAQDPRLRYYFTHTDKQYSISEQDLRCTVEPIPAHYAAGGMYIANRSRILGKRSWK